MCSNVFVNRKQSQLALRDDSHRQLFEVLKGSTESWVIEIINDLCPEGFYDFTWVNHAWFSRKEIHLYSIHAIRLNIQGWWEVHMLQPIVQWCFCRPHKSGWCHFLISFCSFFLLKVSCSIQDYTQYYTIPYFHGLGLFMEHLNSVLTQSEDSSTKTLSSVHMIHSVLSCLWA